MFCAFTYFEKFFIDKKAIYWYDVIISLEVLYASKTYS